MKENLFLISLVVNFLTLSAFADDVVVKCQKHVGDSKEIITLLKNNEIDRYMLVKVNSGHNNGTKKKIWSAEILDQFMICSLDSDRTFSCDQEKYFLSLNPQTNKYSLYYNWAYIENRTGIRRQGKKTLSNDLSCK